MEKHNCSQDVYPKERWGSFHPYKCNKPAVIERDGKWYCKIHDPVYRKSKQKGLTAKWDAKWDAEKKQMRLQSAAPDMYEALRKVHNSIVMAIETQGVHFHENHLPEIRKALDKAEGK